MFQAPARRSLYSGSLTTAHVVRPVEDVTETELNRICTNVKEKVYNSSTVSLRPAHTHTHTHT